MCVQYHLSSEYLRLARAEGAICSNSSPRATTILQQFEKTTYNSNIRFRKSVYRNTDPFFDWTANACLGGGGRGGGGGWGRNYHSGRESRSRKIKTTLRFQTYISGAAKKINSRQWSQNISRFLSTPSNEQLQRCRQQRSERGCQWKVTRLQGPKTSPWWLFLPLISCILRQYCSFSWFLILPLISGFYHWFIDFLLTVGGSRKEGSVVDSLSP